MESKLKLIFFLLPVFLFSGCMSTGIGVVDSGSFENTTILTQNFLDEITLGNVEGAFMVHKFGANDNVGTTLTPISLSGNYQTPTTAAALEILSSNANDNSAGTGARTVRIFGLNSSGDEITEDVSLSGTTPVALSNSYLRLYRAYVLESGSYATQTTPSQLGTITIRGAGAGATWSTISVIGGGFGVGQTEIGVYTVPRGYNCWLLRKVMSINSNKVANLYFFQRQNITDTTAPYSTMRLVEKHIGIANTFELVSRSAVSKFPELTDIGFMGNTDTGTAEVSVEFELVCLDTTLFPSN